MRKLEIYAKYPIAYTQFFAQCQLRHQQQINGGVLYHKYMISVILVTPPPGSELYVLRRKQCTIDSQSAHMNKRVSDSSLRYCGTTLKAQPMTRDCA